MRPIATLLIGLLLLSTLAHGQGGPPLVTDDPGTPGDRHWELNFASQATFSESGSAYQIPALDLNYGYGEDIQLNLNAGWVFAAPSDASRTSGASLVSLAAKWRFVDEDRAGIAVSTYPRVDFHSPFSSNDPLINLEGNRYFLPIEVSKQFGKVGINPEVGYAFYSQNPSELVYGVASSYENEKESKELLAEIHGRKSIGASDHELFFNLGTRYELTEHWKFIGAFGHSIVQYSDSAPFWLGYAGVQFHE